MFWAFWLNWIFVIFSENLRSSEQVRDEDIEMLEAEIKKLEDNYKIIEGATSQLIEAVRVKYVEDFQCEKENQQHKPIIFATQPTWDFQITVKNNVFWHDN